MPSAVDLVPEAQGDCEAAVRLLREWLARAHSSLTTDTLTPSERARIGELAMNALNLLTEREEKLRKRARIESRPVPPA